MDFILEQQAAASASMARVDIILERLVESHYNLEQNFAKLADALNDSSERLTEALAETNRSVSRIALASAQTDARLDRLSERVDVISAKLDALADFVDTLYRRPPPLGA